MKKYLILPLYLICIALSTSIFVGCNDDDDPIETDPKAEVLTPVVENYVNNIVIATYKNLSDETILLYEKLEALKKEKTDANIKAATDAWLSAREHWELSEAFLFGAVSDSELSIDPHIDSWPLDVEGFNKLLNNAGFMESLAKEDGSVWAADHLGFSLLGFHGIEYILFEEGKPKSASKITENELIYATAVAGDLRNQCVRAETAWAGIDNVSAKKQELVEDFELVVKRSTSAFSSYGEEMLNAGKPGSPYVTVTSAASYILEYAFVIADEVGNTKIGTAANESASEEDKNYIESPYSYNSLTDFTNNIKSIENAYLGTAYGVKGASISEYIASVNPEADKAVKDQIAASYAAIKAIPFPFDYTSTQADAAVKVIGTDLAKALKDAKAVLLQE
ncbi:imelysin family protein [Parabacteroides sp. Marseille-P3160]|uniref:imelysin family protein n=1 Tax=Parabacteroides sp. Marseille-P3160 TaxID=1917887 RepID=UPI0009BB2AFF|nr:imelysin family protein [Parabacteroides sp. Marseille-P3160]